MIKKKLLWGVCCVFMFGAVEAAMAATLDGAETLEIATNMDQIRRAIEASGFADIRNPLRPFTKERRSEKP